VASKGRPYKTVRVEGHEVLVGRGDVENDELTFTVAEPDDLWLHVAGGIAGSHVVIRNPEKQAILPRAVIERAAVLAAWHSKARGRARVEVHWCRVADVRKRRGAPAGEVELRRWERIRVSATEPDMV
jgi:predicted ribosome quality control (RQC) complex YloA/Tae2 family protein